MPNIPIFLSSDDNYAPFVATTIASICDNTKSFCEFFVLDGGISTVNQAKICELKKRFDNFSIEFMKIDIETEFADIEYKNALNYVSISTYNRFLIPNLKPNIDRCIYLDVDIIVLGDISSLFNEQLDSYILGAVPELFRKNTQSLVKLKKKLSLKDNSKYFNAGVLLIDSKKWRSSDITHKLFDTQKRYRSILQNADQDVLNLYFENNYKKLPLRYNYFNQNFSEHHNYVIRHFIGPTKPWHIYPLDGVVMHKNISDFWRYVKITPFYNELLSNCKGNAEKSKRLEKLNSIFKKEQDKLINALKTIIE